MFEDYNMNPNVILDEYHLFLPWTLCFVVYNAQGSHWQIKTAKWTDQSRTGHHPSTLFWQGT